MIGDAVPWLLVDSLHIRCGRCDEIGTYEDETQGGEIRGEYTCPGCRLEYEVNIEVDEIG